MIQPTPGRTVWFFLSNTRSDMAGNAGVALAAVVTFVHSDRMVNLCVFDANGVPRPMTSIPLHQEDEDRPAGDYCTWMPYQVSQAKKDAIAAAQPPAIPPQPPVDNNHVAPGAEQFSHMPPADNITGHTDDDPAHPPGSGGPLDPANTAAGKMTDNQKAEGKDGSQPTTGGMTPKSAPVPAKKGKKS